MKRLNIFVYKLTLRILKVMNLLMLTLVFAGCWYIYYADKIASPYHARGNYLVIALFMVLYFAYGRIYEAFLVSVNRISEMIYSQALAALISDMILYLVTWLLTKHLPSPYPLLFTFIIQLIVSALWCYFAQWWYFRTWPPRRTVILYDQRENVELIIRKYNMEKKFQVVQAVSVIEALKDNLSLLEGIDVVFLCGVHSHERNRILKQCIATGIVVYVIPRVGDVIMSGARRVHMFHLPFLRVGRSNPNPEYLIAKRLIDILTSMIALLITLPIMLVTAIIIKTTDGGTIFYKQRRLTKDGREFWIYKFRSMYEDAEKDGVARLSTGDKDTRITPVGKFIRTVRIDELPQFWNILKGDMALVGPRPERPEIAAQYEKELPEFKLRLQVKAGLTGYAQVYGKYNTMPYDKLQMDLMYIAKPSLMEDLRIVFATVKILFLSESTTGVAENQTTALGRENRKVV